MVASELAGIPLGDVQAHLVAHRGLGAAAAIVGGRGLAQHRLAGLLVCPASHVLEQGIAAVPFAVSTSSTIMLSGITRAGVAGDGGDGVL